MLKRTLLALPLVALLSSSLLAGCDDKKETAAKPQEKSFVSERTQHSLRSNSKEKMLSLPVSYGSHQSYRQADGLQS